MSSIARELALATLATAHFKPQRLYWSVQIDSLGSRQTVEDKKIY